MKSVRSRWLAMVTLLFLAGLGTGVALERTAMPQKASPAQVHDATTAVAGARDGLSPAEQLSLMQAAAQAHLQSKEYAKAVEWAQRYLKSGGAESEVRPLLVRAYYELGDYASSARELQWEIQAADRAGRGPGEERLLLLQSCYAKLNDTNAFAWTLEKLVTYYPKKEYWADLLARTQKRPDFGERLSLDVNRLRLLTGTLGGAAEFIAMAAQASQAGFPAEARKVVDVGFATGALGKGGDAQQHRQLQRTLIDEALAHQRRINQREVEAAAEQAKDGIELFNLGFAHVTAGNHGKGLALMEQGMRKGGLANKPQEAKLRLGIAYVLAGQKAKALDTFKTVGGMHGAADLGRIWAIYARNVD